MIQKALNEYVTARKAKERAEAEAKKASEQLRRVEQTLCEAMEQQGLDSVNSGAVTFRNTVTPRFSVNKGDYDRFIATLEEFGEREEDYFDRALRRKSLTDLGKRILNDGLEPPEVMKVFMQRSISVRGWKDAMESF